MNIDFSLIEMQNNVDMSLNLFFDLINGVLSKQAPMKRKRVRRPTQANNVAAILFVVCD